MWVFVKLNQNINTYCLLSLMYLYCTDEHRHVVHIIISTQIPSSVSLLWQRKLCDSRNVTRTWNLREQRPSVLKDNCWPSKLDGPLYDGEPHYFAFLFLAKSIWIVFTTFLIIFDHFVLLILVPVWPPTAASWNLTIIIDKSLYHSFIDYKTKIAVFLKYHLLLSCHLFKLFAFILSLIKSKISFIFIRFTLFAFIIID